MKHLLLTIIGVALIFTSCKKDDDRDNNTTQTDTSLNEEKQAQATTLLQNDVPRSNKLLSDTVIDGETITSPSNLDDNEDVASKLDLLTTGNENLRTTASGEFGWKVSKSAGEEANGDIAFFFKRDGIYYFYTYETEKWGWGYYYTDKAFKYVYFDLGTDKQRKWTISKINTAEFNYETSSGDVECIPYNMNVSLQKFTKVNFYNKIKDKYWRYVIAYSGSISTESSTQNMYKFNADGTYDEATIMFEPANGQTDTTTTERAGTWGVNTSGELQLNNELTYDISYITSDQWGIFRRDVEQKVNEEYTFMTKQRYEKTFGELK